MENRDYTSYKKKYRKFLGFTVFLVWVALAQVVVLSYLSVRSPDIDYYVTSANGNDVPVQPLDRPIVSNQYLEQWSALAVRSVYNVDFLHWKDQLNKASIYFSPEEFQKFQEAMSSSGVTDRLENDKLIASAVVTSSPVILAKGVLEGRFFWKIQVPVLVTYAGSSASSKKQITVSLVVSRVPTLDSSKGIQIIFLQAS